MSLALNGHSLLLLPNGNLLIQVTGQYFTGDTILSFTLGFSPLVRKNKSTQTKTNSFG